MFRVLNPVVHGLVKIAAGLAPKQVEIEAGTVINIWVPTHHNKKPVLVLVHGFATNGILTWLFQLLSLTRNYSVYVPDLLFFGASTTDKPDRSSGFQAECLAQGLLKLGVDKCTLVGLSYGGMVGFKMARSHPDLVESMVACGTVMELTDSITRASLAKIGLSSWSELLLPESVGGVKNMLSVGTHKLPWLPDFFFKHFLEVMFDNRKEKVELLEALVISDKDATVPNYTQRIHLLWGEDDKIFNLEVAQNLKQ